MTMKSLMFAASSLALVVAGCTTAQTPTEAAPASASAATQTPAAPAAQPVESETWDAFMADFLDGYSSPGRETAPVKAPFS